MKHTAHEDTPHRERPAPVQYAPAHAQEDEIGLVDVWLALTKHKTLIVLILALGTVGALIFALVTPTRFTVSSSIQIGKDDKGALIETPETVLNKLTSAYIPAAQRKYLAEHANAKTLPEIDARIPKNSELVILESQGAEAQFEALKQLQLDAIDELKRDHQRTLETLKKRLEVGLQSERTQSESLRDEARIITGQLKRSDELEQSLTAQIAGLKASLDEVSRSKAAAVQETGETSKVMTMLMLDNDIRQTRERLAALEERLFISLPSDREELNKALADNRRAQADQEIKIADLQTQIGTLRQTQALLPPMRSLKPSGPGGAMIIGMAAVLALILGVFAAFFAELLAAARKQVESETTAG